MKVIIIQNTEKDGREAESNGMKPKALSCTHEIWQSCLYFLRQTCSWVETILCKTRDFLVLFFLSHSFCTPTHNFAFTQSAYIPCIDNDNHACTFYVRLAAGLKQYCARQETFWCWFFLSHSFCTPTHNFAFTQSAYIPCIDNESPKASPNLLPVMQVLQTG